MYAIIEIGGTQHKVKEGDTIEVNRVDIKEGDSICVDKVLLISNDSNVDIGRPYISNAKVTCSVLSNFKGDKLIAYKWRRRKGYHRKVGHRQPLTKLIVKEIMR